MISNNEWQWWAQDQSGLACASDLAQIGYQVDVYEKEAYAGDCLYGVPGIVYPIVGFI